MNAAAYLIVLFILAIDLFMVTVWILRHRRTGYECTRRQFGIRLILIAACLAAAIVVPIAAVDGSQPVLTLLIEILAFPAFLCGVRDLRALRGNRDDKLSQ